MLRCLGMNIFPLQSVPLFAGLFQEPHTLVLLSMLLMSLACDAIVLGSNQVEVEVDIQLTHIQLKVRTC
jgi:hypothetical protein